MRKYCNLLLFLTFFLSTFLFAQSNKKSGTISRASDAPSIDGILDEAIWNDLPVLTDFVQYSPNNGLPSAQKSIVKVCYDDYALYVGAVLLDNHPDSIDLEIGERDIHNDLNADMVSVHISPFNDGMNSFYFIVSASGVQSDRKYSAEGPDNDWDAVWESSVTVTDNGWVAEIKIPYSALRFSNTEVQDWGFNVFRFINRYQEWSSWSFVSVQLDQWWKHIGELKGLKDVNPPVRLSFTPYVSSYSEKNVKDDWGYSYNGGMDVKYGIDESFTLDMTLIPDFGQVESDDLELNLTPFEIKYNEKRQFFTEGTELFNKGNLLYTRRIGGTPSRYYSATGELNKNEVLKENPAEAKMINATKISGRNKNGLGIGFLNAMTENTYATAKDTVTGKTREIRTQPFTNYNVLVADQTLDNNSYVSLINTNVSFEDYLSNVAAVDFRFDDAQSEYSVKGTGAFSYTDIKGNSESGFRTDLSFGKISGKFRYRYEMNIISDKYEQNAFGYLRNNNLFVNKLVLNYNIYKPFGIFRSFENEINIAQRNLYEPLLATEYTVEYEFSANFKNYYFAHMHAALRPFESKDYYEARTPGRFVRDYKYWHNCGYIRTDTRKDFYGLIYGSYSASYDYDVPYESFSYGISPTYRISDRAAISFDIDFMRRYNDIGYVRKISSDVLLGKRDVNVITNQINANYLLNNEMSFTFKLRHYWSRAQYQGYYFLTEKGGLKECAYSGNNNINYNAFNIDASFKWNFAPGSELLLVWKNAIYSQERDIEEKYWNNLENTLDMPQINSVSMKFLYYVDYSKLF